MSPNFLMERGAPVVGQSYEQVMGPWDKRVTPIPLKLDRPPTLRDNANVALFLASDDAAYLSGQIIVSTDGGTLGRVAIPFPEDQPDLFLHTEQLQMPTAHETVPEHLRTDFDIFDESIAQPVDRVQEILAEDGDRLARHALQQVRRALGRARVRGGARGHA